MKVLDGPTRVGAPGHPPLRVELTIGNQPFDLEVVAGEHLTPLGGRT